MIKFLLALIALCGCSSNAQKDEPVKNSTTLNFDDISTVKGLGTVPAPYFDLNFSNYNVLKPGDPALKGKISERDLNCAVSSPNSLIGSRFTSDSSENSHSKDSKDLKGAFFEIANATALAQKGLLPYFTLLTVNIKALDAPPGDMTITVNGYSHDRNDTLSWHVDVPDGFHEPFLVKFQEFSHEKWDRLYGAEILVDYGEDALDWEFCIDDLELQFFTLSTIQHEDSTLAETVIKEDL